MAIDYKDDRVEFVEFPGGSDGMLKPTIYGLPVFDTNADDLFEVLKEQNLGSIIVNENGYSYFFQNISIGIYREIIPPKIEEMIEEAAEDGNPVSADEIHYEMRRAKYWSTIGAGVSGYAPDATTG